jgi:hypothetical protein
MYMRELETHLRKPLPLHPSQMVCPHGVISNLGISSFPHLSHTEMALSTSSHPIVFFVFSACLQYSSWKESNNFFLFNA